MGAIATSALAAISLAAGLITIAFTLYVAASILGDWPHMDFTRAVVLLFCVGLGAMGLTVTYFRLRWFWTLLARRP